MVGFGASTNTSFVGDAIRQCKNGTAYDAPMLCAGSTVGTKAAMMKYLEIMIAELETWIHDPGCAFSDQGVHNYLYYSGQLPFAQSMENWVDGIVNTVGIVAEAVVQDHIESVMSKDDALRLFSIRHKNINLIRNKGKITYYTVLKRKTTECINHFSNTL